MTETIFLIEEAPKGGFIASALGESIITDGETYEEIKTNIKDAVDVILTMIKNQN